MYCLPVYRNPDYVSSALCHLGADDRAAHEGSEIKKSILHALALTNNMPILPKQSKHKLVLNLNNHT
jgi:hypothetical protein